MTLYPYGSQEDGKMKLYRYYALDYGEYDLDIRIKVEMYTVDRETPKGYWVRLPYVYKGEKWVSNYAKKRFAYPTKREALVSFIARKRRQLLILKYQLEKAEAASLMAKKMLEEEKYE